MNLSLIVGLFRPAAPPVLPRQPSMPVSVRPLADSLQSDQRIRQLEDACELLADGCHEFDEYIADYVATVPRSAHESDNQDTRRFLDWLSSRDDLTAVQRDLLTDLTSRQAVELIALRQRLAHLRFQKQLLGRKSRLAEVGTNRSLTIHLNPIHVWARFETRELLKTETDIPATVVFFAVGDEVHKVVVDELAEDLLHDLDQTGPMRISDLLWRTHRDLRDGLIETIVELAEAGVISLS